MIRIIVDCDKRDDKYKWIATFFPNEPSVDRTIVGCGPTEDVAIARLLTGYVEEKGRWPDVIQVYDISKLINKELSVGFRQISIAME